MLQVCRRASLTALVACHALPRWTNRWPFHFESDSLLTLHGLAVCALSYTRDCLRSLHYHIAIVRWPWAGATQYVLQSTPHSYRQPETTNYFDEYRKQSNKKPCKMHWRR